MSHSRALPTAPVPTGSAVLDAALDRVTGLDVPPPSPFVNHAPMACEALVTLGHGDDVGRWAEWYAARLTEGAVPVGPEVGARFDHESSLGDLRRLPEWLGYFQWAVDDGGWEAVVRAWVPRLVPGLSSALFHGVIRTAHAVRSLESADTPARRAELARALGLWASWCRPGSGDVEPARDEDLRGAVIGSAADGARCYLADPSIVSLHGVTGAMAVELVVGHLRPADGAAALGRLRAEHATLFGTVERVRPGDSDGDWDEGVVGAAVRSFDAHQVKMVEACRRGYGTTGDGAFGAAARMVTGRS